MKKKIVKRSGSVVDFDPSVFERSLRRAGASRELASEIVTCIEHDIKDGDPTSEIYKRAFEELHTRAQHVAMRYSLKRALFNLGPTGFPFEKFVAELFRRRGYTTKTNLHLRGRCISHEVDVLAISDKRIAMEVKFHNDMHIRSDVKAVLYVKSRFDDLTCRSGKLFSFRKGVVDECIFVTNTKFTKSAIEYASCAGVQLLGWGYPQNINLQTYIRETDSHPVTCLPSLSTSLARELFTAGIVTCRGLLEREDILRSISRSEDLIAEANMLCTSMGRKH